MDNHTVQDIPHIQSEAVSCSFMQKFTPVDTIHPIFYINPKINALQNIHVVIIKRDKYFHLRQHYLLEIYFSMT